MRSPIRSRFKFKQEVQHLTISISGFLDELVEFPCPDLDDVTEVTIDVAEVKSINSLGIRDWMKWSRSLDAANVAIHLINVPYALLQQVNMIHRFLPDSARIESLILPMECKRCRKVVATRIAVPEDAYLEPDRFAEEMLNQKAPYKRCETPECGLHPSFPLQKTLAFLRFAKAF